MENFNQHRRSIRLKGYDYTQPGAYFITLCTWQRKCLFGEVVKGEMRLNQAGRIVQDAWQLLAPQFPRIRMDAFCVMPNHFHGIILISSGVGATRPDQLEAEAGKRMAGNEFLSDTKGSPRPNHAQGRIHPACPTGPPPGSIGAMIGQFKSRATRRLWKLPGYGRAPIWQRNYYEHIIRNEAEWDQIIRYIQANPAQWEEDQLHPERWER